ncbi:palmitoyltransferase with autoacylation activity Pfa4 [Aspergillus lentulus]|uniref:Palmitoyltransferase PFA4 n=1 Tax=Aspergillus lentulus TaxID=293939 RepID=A0ABQ1AFH5_ASPLE|nr:palmitoyltransferase with autoacylation activity Pfa4 [Aspergillus lentulus]GFF38884.1 palmitoyltransferase with autoacylation activity Pfa4 [Aspergillus lentulus]GFF62905.1 palmitoyltransferase with autoacylation activity Pfa4 [Aspergillus lentulus]GFF80873.1 palmitoyltransferase with autoacylation activity Pfa4 [Aspergillus lentulus]GFF85227.1 palmitoyltransferase with autoacylation activity Pfa4 [Aspergillus lentulus]GFG10005.1 palmitoyltransferase with autoacylation activity Pfa4 [Asper
MLCRSFNISQLAIPFVCALISFLAYTSQLFFYYFEEAPLRSQELWRLNIFALCIWVCYYRACTVDPGRIPKDWMPSNLKQLEKDCAGGRQRWCRRCEAFKPPRAHHCKTCQRCIPKMDHHCPWTSNCVSHFTYPHFMRFLFYAVVGMGYLETLLFERASIVWSSRHLPSYLGPSLGQLIHLFILLVVNSLTWLALFILLLRSLWSLALNTTTIESWEIERHETLLRRARHFGGYLSGPGGIQVRIKKQEFPYDIGIWSNIKAGMGGSANVLSWFWPFAVTPDQSTGLEFEVNGFEDPNLSWPPPDPDRIPLPAKREDMSAAIAAADASYHRAVQARNMQRSNDASHSGGGHIQRRKRFHDRFNENKTKVQDSESESDTSDDGEVQDGEEGWKNSEGDRLRDFGVDEEAEFYDEEDIPLGILIQRRRQQ